MLTRIRKRIDKELEAFTRRIDAQYSLKRISPLLFKNIKEFLLRDGKRIRPILFVIGYLGYAEKPARGLYTSALSIELLHDFMLVHDDVIDKSDLRRGKPSMHKAFSNYLSTYKNIKFNGQDLAIVAGDVMYAMAIHSFLTIKEAPGPKEHALKKFVEAAAYTGCGEFIEILLGMKRISDVSKTDIYRIYDYKTAYYTFSCPLAIGAILAGAPDAEVRTLSSYGIYLGRAFQIKDDIIGIFDEEKDTGKSLLTDLKESKKTILIWLAYKKGNNKQKSEIRKILRAKRIGKSHFAEIKRIMVDTGAKEAAKKEINKLLKKSRVLTEDLRIKKQYKDFLKKYPEDILSV